MRLREFYRGRKTCCNIFETNVFGDIFSRDIDIICISGGYQDFLPGVLHKCDSCYSDCCSAMQRQLSKRHSSSVRLLLRQTRLDLAPPDCEYLRRMGHFTSGTPKPLTWRQKLRAVLQAVDALVYLRFITMAFKARRRAAPTRGGRGRRASKRLSRASKRDTRAQPLSSRRRSLRPSPRTRSSCCCP